MRKGTDGLFSLDPACPGLSLMARKRFRVQRDLVGEKNIPAETCYGMQIVRALEDFQISGVLINHYPGFVEAWAMVKLSAAGAGSGGGAMKKRDWLPLKKPRMPCSMASTTISSWCIGSRAALAPLASINAHEVLATIALKLTLFRKGEYE